MAQHITPFGLQAQGNEQKKESELEKYANKIRNYKPMTDEEVIGMALGMGLRYLWDNHIGRKHARDDAQEQQNAEVQKGKISDIEAFRKANGNPTAPTLNVPADWREAIGGDAKAPATGTAWGMYAESNGLPGSRDYQQEAIASVMPTPKLNTGAMTTDDLVAALADPYKNNRRWF